MHESSSSPDLPDGDRPPGRVGAIVVGAGRSSRMDGVDKLFAALRGRPVLSYTLQTLQDSPLIDEIALVMSSANLDRGRSLTSADGWSKVVNVCLGGDRRQDSVRRGLAAMPDAAWIVVHDAARPLMDRGLIAAGLESARITGAAVAAVPVTDTIKSADARLVVSETVPRDGLWAAQTPQVFSRTVLEDAHQQVSETVTDDAAMVERNGGTVRLFMGSYRNLKITTRDDLSIAEAVLGDTA